MLKLQPIGMAYIDRERQETLLALPTKPSDEALLHPHLGSTALIAAYWAQRPSFHAGSFVLGGGVWAVLGDRERGKSSLLAWLAARDVPVFSDDLVVLDGDAVLAGPRCLDLRAGAASHFAAGSLIRGAGTRDRWRVSLPQVPARLPLRGWIELQWDDQTRIELLRTDQKLARLEPHRGLRVGPIPLKSWLFALARPMFVFSRPQSWQKMDDAMAGLMTTIQAI